MKSQNQSSGGAIGTHDAAASRPTRAAPSVNAEPSAAPSGPLHRARRAWLQLFGGWPIASSLTRPAQAQDASDDAPRSPGSDGLRIRDGWILKAEDLAEK